MPALEHRNTEKSEKPEDDPTSEKDKKHNHRSGGSSLRVTARGDKVKGGEDSRSSRKIG
jgi:hypothetical protein